jgi:hypothetical protein
MNQQELDGTIIAVLGKISKVSLHHNGSEWIVSFNGYTASGATLSDACAEAAEKTRARNIENRDSHRAFYEAFEKQIADISTCSALVAAQKSLKAEEP